MNDYEKQAQDFLQKHNITLDITYVRTGEFFPGDKESRDIFKFTLTTPKGSYSHEFGDSMANTTARVKERCLRVSKRKTAPKPSAYDILACLETHGVGTFEDFCADFGYNDWDMHWFPDVMKLYMDIQNQYTVLCRILTTEQQEELNEII